MLPRIHADGDAFSGDGGGVPLRRRGRDGAFGARGALPVQATAEEGGVRVLGRARFSLVYENAEHGVCRAEKGAEFTLKAQGSAMQPPFRACG